MMVKRKMVLGLAAGLVLASPAVLADGYVVGHLTVRVGPDDVREIFLGNMQYLGDIRLVPVHNSAVQGEFLDKVLKTDPDRYAAVWARKAFRQGAGEPAVEFGDAAVLDFVRRTPGAIGYVSHDPGDANVILRY